MARVLANEDGAQTATEEIGRLFDSESVLQTGRRSEPDHHGPGKRRPRDPSRCAIGRRAAPEKSVAKARAEVSCVRVLSARGRLISATYRPPAFQSASRGQAKTEHPESSALGALRASCACDRSASKGRKPSRTRVPPSAPGRVDGRQPQSTRRERIHGPGRSSSRCDQALRLARGMYWRHSSGPDARLALHRWTWARATLPLLLRAFPTCGPIVHPGMSLASATLEVSLPKGG